MRSLPTSGLRALALVLVALVAIAAAAVIETLRQGEDLLIQRKYREAAAALERALDDETANRDRVLLLLGRARLLAGDPAGAVTAYQRLLSEQPGSALTRQARFLWAKALEEQGQLRQAAQIYREEIARLIGLDRKEEIAATYLSLAERALGQEKPDYDRAVTFFDLALDLGLPAPKARAVRLKAAEARLGGNNLPDAITRFSSLVDELALGEGKLRAMLGFGKARRMAGDRAGARAVLRDLRGLSADAPEAADAAYEIALSYGVPGPAPAELDRAVGSLQELAARHPAHPKAKIALFLAAQCYRHVGRGEDALKTLRAFLSEQGDSGLEDVAAARAMVGDVLAAQDRPAEAIDAWREYLSAHPAHREWERVQRAIVDTEYAMAAADYTGGKETFDSARTRFGAFARTYPLDGRNPDILFSLGDMLLQEEQFAEAREAFNRCVSKYPGKNASSHAQFAVGQIFETKTFNYHDALEAYRKVTWGPWATAAQQRIAALTRKHLSLLTPRIFRTDEKPIFQITSRNIEKLRVRVFRLDLEDYFRATHTAGRVERLDIEVIEPDSTLESVVSDYQKYQETTRDIALEATEPGAYVVKVDDRELEATTMVLVSDIALIAKSSRHEFFVFTQNTKENRVEGGVKLVLSDGSKVIAEGVTGADGVWRFKGEELKNHDDLRVFAVNDAGSGASSINLSGMGYTPGLTPKGYLFTDRPAYQPGQSVHIKGLVREVGDGLYRMPRPDGWRVQVFSSGGRLMLQREIRFTDFGTFAVDVTLPAQAELGSWRVAVNHGEPDAMAFSGGFQVARYERPRLSLSAELDEPVVFRGEAIAGRMVLRYFFGEPAVGKEVDYTLIQPDGGRVERRGTTNAAGEVPFSFTTDEFGEEALAVIQARVAAENVATQLVVPVVTTEFEPSLSMVRPVYLAGEPFDVDVKIADRSGKPLAREATAVLLRLEPVGNARRQVQAQQMGQGGVVRRQVVEVEVERKPLATDAEGKGRVRFAAAKGGRYRVRLEARDRFGTLVTGQIDLTVSGEDDEIKLRLLSDRQSYEVGETAKVKVANRAGARLVLQTVQGDGILTYRALVLPAGESQLEVALGSLHAPNFALALAMVDGQKLHVAEREFRVNRDLKIDVGVPAEIVRPGAEVEVTVRATDPQGKPVQAEMALALVDQALLAVHPDTTPAIGPFFYGQMRETSFRTVSSCTWSYRGRTTRVSEALLAEERRREEEGAGERDRAGAASGADDFFVGNGRQPQGGAGGGGAGGRGRQYRGPGNATPGPAGPATAGPAGPSTPGGPTTGGRRPAQDAPAEQQELQVLLMDEIANNMESFQHEARGLGRNRQVRLFAGLPLRARQEIYFKQLHEHADGLVDQQRASDEPRTDFSETGVWISSLTTGADGRAKVKIAVPDSTTAWTLVARAITADTDVGQGEGSLRAQKELQAALVLPLALTEGDRTGVGARIHNLTDGDLSLQTELVTRRGEESSTATQNVTVAAHREVQPAFELAATSAQDVQLRLRASGAGLEDELVREVPVLPFGTEFRDGRSGVARQSARASLGLPEGREYTSLGMLVEVGPDPGRDLVAAALGIGYRPRNCMVVDVTNLARASRGLAALVVLDYLEQSGGGNPADQSRLLGLAQSAVAGLVTAQMGDGALAWVGKRSQDLRSTCQALRLFGKAGARGVTAAEQARNQAAEWLLQRLRRARTEERADILWALATVDRARFESLNSLQRVARNLPVDGMARLALAWHAVGRPELAGEVLAVMRPKLQPSGFQKLPVEAVALAAQALLAADRRDALGNQAVEWLRGARRGVSWGTPEATVAALGALSLAQRTAAGPARTGAVAIVVNGRKLASLPESSAGMNAQFPVPQDWLRERDNQVDIRVTGGAEVHWSVNLTGFARGFRDADRNPGVVRIEREYLADFLRLHDKDLKPGFAVIEGRNIEKFENRITQLEVGETGRVQVRFWLPNERIRGEMTPLVVEEPIPAGYSVPRQSLSGNYEHVEFEPSRMVFYYREGVTSDTISYELQARFPGKYRALPTRVYGALRPDLLAYGTVGELAVHERGKGEDDPYRLTPDELYHLGKGLFDDAQNESGAGAQDLMRRAGEHLDRLLANWQKQDYRLRDRYFKEVARMMLYLSIERGESRSVVRFFEELKDRYADLVIPFDKILEVGKAYVDIGEFEAALLVFRATAEASFLKEAAVAQTLQGLGEVKASVQFLQRLLRAYPDLNTMRVSLYSIGQKLAALAAGMSPGAPVDDKVGSAEDLRAQALVALREFLVLYPEDPLAEEVSFAWATTYVEGKDLKAALDVSSRALQRYPGSTFEDEFLYTVGYAEFVLGDHDAAFAALQRVAQEEFTRDRGGRGPSESRYHAIYLQGQIHHARGEPEKALAAYEEVEDRFTDAGEASNYFLRKDLVLPEVSAFAMDEEPNVSLTYRNVAKVQVQVFRVDLMRLYLLEKSLNDIRGIQLHGIRPFQEFEVELGDGRDYRNKDNALKLDLKEPGAYLVVARGDDELASGMVLRTDLAIEAQESLDTGRIRVNVKADGGFVAEAHVKVVGSSDQRFRSGDTDLRGVFVADQLVGMATVIVKKGDQYAFYRGKGIHQPGQFRPAPKPRAQQQEKQQRGTKKGKDFDAYEQNMLLNDSNRARQLDWLDKNVLNVQQKGVEVYRTK